MGFPAFLSSIAFATRNASSSVCFGNVHGCPLTVSDEPRRPDPLAAFFFLAILLTVFFWRICSSEDACRDGNAMILQQQYADVCPKCGKAIFTIPEEKRWFRWPDPSVAYCPFFFFFSGRYFFSIDATIT